MTILAVVCVKSARPGPPPENFLHSRQSVTCTVMGFRFGRRSTVLGPIDAGGGALVSCVHYDSNTYIVEKRRALRDWCALLAKIIAGEDTWPADVGQGEFGPVGKYV